MLICAGFVLGAVDNPAVAARTVRVLMSEIQV